MDDKEKKLSNYIDSLNMERKPDEHGSEIEAAEMEELFETARFVRSLKEADLPEINYGKKLATNINRQLSKGDLKRKDEYKEVDLKQPRKRWLYGMASVAAAAALIITLNTVGVGPFSKTNMVYAMEKAFKGVKAYHGILQVVETNAEGKSTTQAKLEVWADKEGRYYVKGLEGVQKDLITVNDGQNKWQIQPKEKEVEIFTAFPDPYSFTFEIGKEIEYMKDALETKVIGEDIVAGRKAVIIEVTPQGGSTYRIWIDKETKMPLQKQSAMEYSLQYTVNYIDISFEEVVPRELLVYSVPKGFKEININSEQVVSTMEEAKGIVGFTPKSPQNMPLLFTQDNIVVMNNEKIVKINYVSKDNKKVVIIQKKASDEFKPASMAVLGKINNKIAEIQSPVQVEVGVLQSRGTYVGATGITSVRWQEEGFEYAVLGNVSLEELTMFIKDLIKGAVELSSKEEYSNQAQIKVPVDLEVEEEDQKNVDAGHSPWKLDPAFVAQVFVSLKLSPEGIVGDYPINYEEFKVIKNNGREAVVEVSGDKTPIRKVYLERLIRQDNTGIWTVVGYNPKSN